jgi:cytosine permease
VTVPPDYIAKAKPNPASNRAPWYTNTAPTYAGVFLWVVFYMEIAKGTIDRAGVGLSLVALVVAGLLSYFLFYLAPAMLGMQTGLPLYVVGASTFGARGAYLMPGLMMGVLQVGWVSVNTLVSTSFILAGLGSKAGPGTLRFGAIAALWGYGLCYVGVKGIKYVSRCALYFACVPLLMIVLVFLRTASGIPGYTPIEPKPYFGFTMLIQIVVGFFATAGAAGADFGMKSRDRRDVKLGGLVGITLAVLIAGGLPLLSVAGARAVYGTQGYTYAAVITGMGGTLATIMFFLFAIASISPACTSAFIAGNSFATMLPGVPRMASTMLAATAAVALAITGVAGNLIGLFTIIGASFGPICGAMAADYLLCGRKWAGPREGINFAGYGAWAVGFLVGILPFLPIPGELKPWLQPYAVYSFLVAFLAYTLLAKAGMEPKVMPIPVLVSAA